MNPRRLSALVVLTVLMLCGCGTGQSGPEYWVQHSSNAGDLYISTVIDGDEISGYAQYLDGSFQHYAGTKNSDGTFQASAYTGVTLKIDGDVMTGTSYTGTNTWEKSTESEWKEAGGP